MAYPHLEALPDDVQQVTRQMDYLAGLPFQGREQHIFIAELARHGMRYLGTVGVYVGERGNAPDQWLADQYGLKISVVTVPFRSSSYEMWVGTPKEDATATQRANFQNELLRLMTEKLPEIKNDSLPPALRQRYVAVKPKRSVSARLTR